MNRRPTAAKSRVLDLLMKGLSERQVMAAMEAEGCHVSKGTVSNWRREAIGKPVTATPPKARTAKPSSSSPPSEEWELPGVDLVHLPAELLERLGKRLTRKITETIDSQVVDHELLGKLVQTHERIMKALVMSRPPAEHDPEKDPSNVEQAAIAVGHVRRMIEGARKRRHGAAA